MLWKESVQYVSMFKMLFCVYGITGPYCGDKSPPVIRTVGNVLVMRFYTDFFMEMKGFRAYWSTNPTQPPPTETPLPPNPWDDIPIGTTGSVSFASTR